MNGTLRERIDAFCATKRISVDALQTLGTRVDTRRNGSIRLAWSFPTMVNGKPTIDAVKFRDIATGERDALKPSTFRRPLIVGNRDALDIFIAEGETDAARLYDLVGDVAMVMVLPAGALAWKKEWAQWIPRGASIYLAHDADEAGDVGAEKAARIIGSATTRVKPPTGDWCEWDGTREEFIRLVGEAKRASIVDPLPIESWAEFRDASDAELPYLIADVWAEGATAFIGAEPKAGKTWIALAIALCVATGYPWLSHAVPQAVPVIYIALEGHRAAVKARIGCLARGLGLDPDSDDLRNLHVVYKPRGINLSDAVWADRLCAKVAATGARLVIVDTLRSAASVRESNEGARDMAQLLQLLSPLIADHVSIGWLHHYTKLTETRQLRAAADRMSGSGALRGHMDFGLFITKADFTQRRMRLEMEVRDGVALKPFGVRLAGEGTAKFGGFRYEDTAELVIELEVLGENAAKAPSGEIAGWVKTRPYGRAATSEICDYFDISRETLRRRRPQICSCGVEYVDEGRFSRYQVVSVEEEPLV